MLQGSSKRSRSDLILMVNESRERNSKLCVGSYTHNRAVEARELQGWARMNYTVKPCLKKGQWERDRQWSLIPGIKLTDLQTRIQIVWLPALLLPEASLSPVKKPVYLSKVHPLYLLPGVIFVVRNWECSSSRNKIKTKLFCHDPVRLRNTPCTPPLEHIWSAFAYERYAN